MIERVDGMMNAPPTPITARAAISIPGVVAIADSADPAPKTTSPKLSARRRPKRSPSARR